MSRYTLVIVVAVVFLFGWFAVAQNAEKEKVQSLCIQAVPGHETIRVKTAGTPNQAKFTIKAFFDPNSLKTEEHEPGKANWDCTVFEPKIILGGPNANKPTWIKKIGGETQGKESTDASWDLTFEGTDVGTWELTIEAWVTYDRKLLTGKNKGNIDGKFPVETRRTTVVLMIVNEPYKLVIQPEDDFRKTRNVLGIGEPATVIVEKWNPDDPNVKLVSISATGNNTATPPTSTLLNVGNDPNNTTNKGYFEAGHWQGEATIIVGVQIGLQTIFMATRVTVQEPTGIGMIKTPNTFKYHKQGIASAGFKGTSYYMPDNVSFWKMQGKEGNGKVETTGYMADFFMRNYPNGYDHPESYRWFVVNKGLSTITNRINTLISSDTVEKRMPVLPYSDGNSILSIKWLYLSGTHRDAIKKDVRSYCAINAAGDIHISKGGEGGRVSKSAKLNDRTSTYKEGPDE